jgi:hypothetical protein
MNFTIEELIEDHKDFVFTKLMIASATIDDKHWTSVIGCLASKYKFAVSTDTFAGMLGTDIVIIPEQKVLFSAKVFELFVRYNFMNDQDAAIHEMLRSERFSKREWFPSNKYSNVYHRFATPAEKHRSPVKGVIMIDKELDSKFTNQWNFLKTYSKLNTDINMYIQKLKELSNE